jgi:hypothetical protein
MNRIWVTFFKGHGMKTSHLYNEYLVGGIPTLKNMSSSYSKHFQTTNQIWLHHFIGEDCL